MESNHCFYSPPLVLPFPPPLLPLAPPAPLVILLAARPAQAHLGVISPPQWSQRTLEQPSLLTLDSLRLVLLTPGTPSSALPLLFMSRGDPLNGPQRGGGHTHL